MNKGFLPSTRFFQTVGLMGFIIGGYNVINNMIAKANQKQYNTTIKESLVNLNSAIENLDKKVTKVDGQLTNFLETHKNGGADQQTWFKTFAEKFTQNCGDETAKKIENAKLIIQSVIQKANELEELNVKKIDKSLSVDDLFKIQERIEVLIKELPSKLNEAVKNLNNMTPDTDKVLSKTLKAVEEWESKNDKFLDNISDNIDNINNFFINLSHEQNIALFNFSGILLIFITLINILFIFYGNKLLDYFNLENRFPRLAIFINLRRKFQQYYLLWDTFIVIWHSKFQNEV